MSGYVSVLLLTLMPALGNFAGGLLADRIRVSPRTLSLALHVAAGIVFAVVGVELMPQALAGGRAWLVTLLFVAGGAFAVLVDTVMESVRLRSRTGSATEGAEAGPWAIYFGVAVDLFSDGVMIGTGSTIDPALGLLLSLGQVPADIPEGFATVATFKAQGMPRGRRLLVAASFAVPILLGATLSYFALRGRPEVYQFGLLAFTAGILLTVAVEEMVTEAHRGDDARLAGLFLVGGFALFVLLGEYLEGRQEAGDSATREMRSHAGLANDAAAVGPAGEASVRTADQHQAGEQRQHPTMPGNQRGRDTAAHTTRLHREPCQAWVVALARPVDGAVARVSRPSIARM